VKNLEGSLIARQSELPLDWTADMPDVSQVTKYAAQNQTKSGMWLRSMTVPAVRLVSPLQ